MYAQKVLFHSIMEIMMLIERPQQHWEVYQREDCTGFIIQILNEELDGGKVVFKGNIPTSFLYT